MYIYIHVHTMFILCSYIISVDHRRPPKATQMPHQGQRVPCAAALRDPSDWRRMISGWKGSLMLWKWWKSLKTHGNYDDWYNWLFNWNMNGKSMNWKMMTDIKLIYEFIIIYMMTEMVRWKNCTMDRKLSQALPPGSQSHPMVDPAQGQGAPPPQLITILIQASDMHVYVYIYTCIYI